MSRNPFHDLGFAPDEAATLHARTQRTAARVMKNPPHPGEVLQDMLESAGLTVSAFARRLKMSRPSLSSVINGRTAVSAELAIRLAAALGGTAESWLRMQLSYDLAKAQKKRRPKIELLHKAA